MKQNLKTIILNASINEGDKTKTFEDIKTEWCLNNYSNMGIDYKQIRMRCLCGKVPIKHCYSIKNIYTGDILEPIGKTCVSEIFPELRQEITYLEQKFLWDTEGVKGNFICTVCFGNNIGSNNEMVCTNIKCISTYYSRIKHTQLINILENIFTKDLTTNINILKKRKEQKVILEREKRRRQEFEINSYNERLVKIQELIIKKRQKTQLLAIEKWRNANYDYKYNKGIDIIKNIYTENSVRNVYNEWKAKAENTKKIWDLNNLIEIYY